MRERPSLNQLIDGITAGDRLMLSRAITLVESSLPTDMELATELMAACMPMAGNAYRLGVTGVPGVGKSTFIDAFGSFLLAQGHKLAVLAIDPSSSRSGGSILGDKTRMNELSHHANAYVRPSPTGGSLGGVARKTRETMLLCEAAGYDLIMVETVGVGQSELAVHAMVDFFLLLMLPNAGDELQGIKKGIMEMADALVIHKADGSMLPKARQAKATYGQALRLFPLSDSDWTPPVLLCSSLEKEGFREILEGLEAYRELTQQNGYWASHRQQQATYWMEESIRHLLEQHFYQHPRILHALPGLKAEVLAQRKSPIQAAQELMKLWETGA